MANVQFQVERHHWSGAPVEPFPVWVKWPAILDPDKQCKHTFFALAGPEDIAVMGAHGIFYGRADICPGVCLEMGKVIE